MRSIPVLFRKSRGEVIAVFPTELGGHSYMDMTCYVHVGQHSSCSIAWYYTTKAAKPAEYADLLAELTDIYTNDPDEPVALVVRQRMASAYTDERRRQQTEYKS